MSNNQKTIVQGEDIIITIDGKPTLHATSHSLKIDLELKDVRTKDTNGKEKFPADIAWSVEGEGLVVIDPDLAATHLSPDEVIALVLGKSLVGVVMKGKVAGQGLTKNYTGNGYINSFSLSTPAGDNSTYSYSITGSGDLKQSNPTT